jgi:hypothetical protein
MRMTSMTIAHPLRGAAVIIAVAAGVLGSASCSGSARPAPQDSGIALENHQVQLETTIVQCFAGHQLIPAKALQGSSAWLKAGHVTENLKFGDWYGDTGAGVVVKGKMIGDWVAAALQDSRNWPASICGPVPSASATP